MLALKICHRWNKGPEWFFDLDADMKSTLIAEWRIANCTPEEIKRKRKNANSRLIEKQKKQAQERGAYYVKKNKSANGRCNR